MGNKVDSKREVESFSLETLKSSNIVAFYEVSAKLNTNVEETFTNIAKVLHKNPPAPNSEVKMSKGDKIRPPPPKKVEF